MVVSAKQLRINTSEILKSVQRLGSVTVTLHGKSVEKLSALNEKPAMRVEDHPAFGMWAGREDMRNVHTWLAKIRIPRYFR